MTTRLKRLKILGNPQVQSTASTAGVGRVALARHIALRGISLGSVVGQDNTAPTLLAKLDTSKGEALLLARRQALLGGEGRGIKVNGIGESAALGRIVGVAAERLVVIDSDVAGALGKGRILPD